MIIYNLSRRVESIYLLVVLGNTRGIYELSMLDPAMGRSRNRVYETAIYFCYYIISEEIYSYYTYLSMLDPAMGRSRN